MARKQIRLLCETQNTSRTVRDTATAERPFWWAGSDVAIQLALSDRGAFILFGAITTLIVEVKALEASAAASPLMRKVYGPGDCDPTFTAADWPASTKQLLTATFTAAEAALAPGSYRLIVRHEDGAGLKNTYLSTEIAVFEDHSESTSISAPPTPPTEYFTKPEADSRYVQTGQLAGAVATAANAVALPDGPFADAAAALAGGVSLGRTYFRSDFSTAVVQFPIHIGPFVAQMGDSHTARGSGGPSELLAEGFGVQARARIGSRFDFVPNSLGDLHFATFGMEASQILSTWLPQVLTSGARLCIFMAGTNDAIHGIPTATTVNSLVSMAVQLRAAGIYPVFVEPPPIPLAFGGNSGGLYSAGIAALWAALPAALTAVGCYYLKSSAALEATPGSRNGIGNNSFFVDTLHFNYAGSGLQGRDLAAFLKAKFSFPDDPYGMASTIITNNPQMAGTSGQPTDWFAPGVPSGATLNGKSIVSLGGGNNAWRLDYNEGTTSGNLTLGYVGSNIGSTASKIADAILTLEVISGALLYSKFSNNFNGGGMPGYDMRVPTGYSATPGYLTPADGPIVLRTPKTSGNGSTVGITPTIETRGTAVFQISRVMSRSYP